MQIMAYYPDFADPANYPYLFFASANAVKDGMNGSNFKNADVDKHIAIANEQSDPKVRAEALKKVFKIANEDVARRADLLAGLGDGDQQQVQAHRLQRLLVQHPLGDPRLRPEVAHGRRGRGFSARLDRFCLDKQSQQAPMDKLAEAVDRLDRLRFPSDISFDRDGRRARRDRAAGEPREGRELPEPHLALRARRRGEAADRRAERRRSSALLAG